MEITQLLLKVKDGDREAYNSLYPLVYEKLKSVAQSQLNREFGKNTICKTELVHEVYEKMVDQKHADYQSRAHFFSIAARSMRQILVDYARKKNTAKAGGQFSRLTLDVFELGPGDLGTDGHADRILALNELLINLKDVDERLCNVVELRFFVGLSIEETAQILRISTSTANRDWLKARGWLFRQLNEDDPMI